MARIREFIPYDLEAKKQLGMRLINVDHIVEVVSLVSTVNPVTRIKLINGDHLDAQGTVHGLTKYINEQ